MTTAEVCSDRTELGIEEAETGVLIGTNYCQSVCWARRNLSRYGRKENSVAHAQ